MRKRLAVIAALALAASPAAAQAAPYAPFNVPDSSYECSAYIDPTEGMTDDYTYTFPTGQITAKPGQPLLMIHGEFFPYEVIIRNARAYIPVRALAEIVNAAKFDWDAKTKSTTVTSYLSEDPETTVFTAGSDTARHRRVTAKAFAALPMPAPAIIYKDQMYVPAAGLRTPFALQVEYVTGIAYNPVVSIGFAMAGGVREERLNAARAILKETLNRLTPETVTSYAQGRLTADNFDDAKAVISAKIDNMKFLHELGHTDVYAGPYTILRWSNGHDERYYLHYIYHAGAALKQVDLTNPEIFVPMYFAD